MPRLKVNKKLEPFLRTSKSIKVAIGGRGSGKSIGFGDMLTMKMDTEGADIYCLREFQDSIADSVHRVFKNSIQDRLNLDGWGIFENKIVAPGGAQTTYKGANRNPDAMQSAQGYKYSWFEEAHRASKASLDKLLPTIIRNPGAECWFSANPQSRGDAFSQRFIVPYLSELEKYGYYEDDLHLIVVVNWRDNPWWNEEQESLRAWDYENRPRSEYDWIWEGKFLDTIDGAIIQAEWFDCCVDAHKKLGFEPLGMERVSYDPSDVGPDPEALAYMHGNVVMECMQADAKDSEVATHWACGFANEIGVDAFLWDCDGLGSSLKYQINQAFKGKRIQVDQYKGSEGVLNPDEIYDESELDSKTEKPRTNREIYKNQRAQFYGALRDRIYKTWLAVSKGRYIDPDELISFSSDIKHLDILRSELCRIPRKPDLTGKFLLYTKREMVDKFQVESPNCADCIAMLMKPVENSFATVNKIPHVGWGSR